MVWLQDTLGLPCATSVTFALEEVERFGVVPYEHDLCFVMFEFEFASKSKHAGALGLVIYFFCWHLLLLFVMYALVQVCAPNV
jgi:hypothetical protein